jgi:hypothetical protein
VTLRTPAAGKRISPRPGPRKPYYYWQKAGFPGATAVTPADELARP